MTAVDKRSEQSIVSIRQNADDYAASRSEVQQLRERLLIAEADANRQRQGAEQARTDLAVKDAELRKVQLSLDAVLKEFVAKKSAADLANLRNTRLQRDLERSPGVFSAAAAASSPAAAPGGVPTAHGGGGSVGRIGTANSSTRPATTLSAQGGGANSSNTRLGAGAGYPRGTPTTSVQHIPSPPKDASADDSPSRRITNDYINHSLDSINLQLAADQSVNGANNNATVVYSSPNPRRAMNANQNQNQHQPSSAAAAPMMALSPEALATRAGSNVNLNNAARDPLHPCGPLALYLHLCLESGVEPHKDVVKTLYSPQPRVVTTITAAGDLVEPHATLVLGSPAAPISYAQLLRLAEVFQHQEALSPAEIREHWPLISRIEVCCAAVDGGDSDEAAGGDDGGGEDAQEGSGGAERKASRAGPAYGAGTTLHQQQCLQLLPAIIEKLIPTLSSARIAHLGDDAAAAVAGAIAIAVNLTTLELPQLCVTDMGFQHVMKVVNRARYNPTSATTTTDSPNAPVVGIMVNDLDLSRCSLQDGASFSLIKGPYVAALNLSRCSGLADKFLGEITTQCPNLRALNIDHCTALSRDAILFLNLAKQLRTLHVVGCTSLSSLKLSHVTTLFTDLRGVTYVDCPMLQRIPSPITAFNCVGFDCPNLTHILLHNSTLTGRECGVLGDCTALTHARFVNCRVAGFDCFLRRMRHLHTLALHGCKGVTDRDLAAVGPTVRCLDLTDSFCLTDKLLQKLAGTCGANLESVTLKRCAGISDVGLFFLTQCPRLRYANLLAMRKVTTEGVRRLCSQLPSLSHLAHESFVAAEITVDRDDNEENELALHKAEERAVVVRRQNISLGYHPSRNLGPGSEASRPPTTASLGCGAVCGNCGNLVAVPRGPPAVHRGGSPPGTSSGGWRSPVTAASAAERARSGADGGGNSPLLEAYRRVSISQNAKGSAAAAGDARLAPVVGPPPNLFDDVPKTFDGAAALEQSARSPQKARGEPALVGLDGRPATAPRPSPIAGNGTSPVKNASGAGEASGAFNAPANNTASFSRFIEEGNPADFAEIPPTPVSRAGGSRPRPPQPQPRPAATATAPQSSTPPPLKTNGGEEDADDFLAGTTRRGGSRGGGANEAAGAGLNDADDTEVAEAAHQFDDIGGGSSDSDAYENDYEGEEL